MFASRAGVASHAANEALYRAHPGKAYALPEWGLSIDDPAFVRRICTFLKTRPRTKIAAYYVARPRSPYDLGSSPAARAEYRRCITPLGAKASMLTPGPPTSAQLKLAPKPVKGDAPLDVTFSTHENLPKPVVRWGSRSATAKWRRGRLTASRSPTYSKDGVYTATLIVYLEPPFTAAAIRYVTNTRVKVGKKADPAVASSRHPRRQGTVLGQLPRGRHRARDGWDFVPGDGTSRSGQGKPPRFLGNTYTTPGIARADRSPGVERAPAGVHRRRGAVEMPAVLVGAAMLPAAWPAFRLYRGLGTRLELVLFAVGYLIVWVAAAALLMQVMAPAGTLLLVAGLCCSARFRRSRCDAAGHRSGSSCAARACAQGSSTIACAGCCAGLMLALVALDAMMSVLWMAGLVGVVLAEKTLRHGVLMSRVAGVAILALAALTLL